MDWTGVLIAAVIGAVSAAIAKLFVRDTQERKGAYALAFVVTFGILMGLSRAFVSPIIEEQRAINSIERLPVYQAIKLYEPASYEAILSKLKQVYREDLESVQAAVRPEIAKVAVKRMGFASDDAITMYMRATLQEMRELDVQGGDLCYRFLFPQHATGRTYPEFCV